MYWWRIFLYDENRFLLVTNFFRLPWITSNYILTIDLIFWIKGTVHVIFAFVEAMSKLSSTIRVALKMMAMDGILESTDRNNFKSGKKNLHNEIDLLPPELTLYHILHAIVVEFFLQILW